MRILIVEDEKKLLDILVKAFKMEQFSTDSAFDGLEGFNKAIKNNYDLIVLDIMLPIKDGVSICKDLRARNIHTPIIMLTARGALEDRVLSLNSGADDYITKPFEMSELFARLRAVLRRRKTTDSDIFKISDLIVDRVKHEVTRGGKKIELTPKEYKLLDTLLAHRGEAVGREQLIQNAWNSDFKETNNELNVHIAYLRKKIDSDQKTPLIHTIRGVGFMLEE